MSKTILKCSLSAVSVNSIWCLSYVTKTLFSHAASITAAAMCCFSLFINLYDQDTRLLFSPLRFATAFSTKLHLIKRYASIM
jgi:hypothetical protein